MSDDRLADLLLRWEELHEQGRDATPEELCRDCPDLTEPLARRIEALKALHWMKEPVNGEPGADAVEETLPAPTPLAGRYRLDRLVGEGGFGQVWKAFDLELERPVAVKVPKPSRRFSPSEIDTFVAEARKLARLRHPGIVAVHDICRSGGAYFFVEDWIEGSDLASRMRQGRLTRDEAVRIVIEVAGILAYAHGEGFVHLDIKPANVLLDANGNPLVTDFGIAATEQELLHEPRRVLATLAYASPEQLSGQPIDARSDLWSLGVVLYELLADHLPFDGPDPAAVREKILSQDPPPLRTVDGTIPPDLERICLKCLAKNPADRYPTAQGLAEALAATRLQRSNRKGRILAVIAVLAVVLGAALAVKTNWTGTPRTPDQGSFRKDDELPTTEAVRSFEGHAGPVLCVAFHPEGKTVASGGADATVRLWPVDGDRQGVVLRQVTPVKALAFTADGKTLACGCENGTVRLWDLSGAEPKEGLVLPGHAGPITCVALSPDGKFLVTGGKDGTVRLLNRAAKPTAAVIPRAGGVVLWAGFSPEGDKLLVGYGDGPGHPAEFCLWELRTAAGQPQLALRRKAPLADLAGVKSLLISPDGTLILAGAGGEVYVWGKEEGRDSYRVSGSFPRPASCVALSPGGGLALSGGQDGPHLWDVKGMKGKARLVGHEGAVNGVAFSQDGKLGASGGADGAVRLWRIEDAGTKTGLRSVNLDNTPTGDEGLRQFEGADDLGELRLSGTKITDAGLASLRGCKRLQVLDLNHTKITDEGLKHLARLTDLRRLGLSGTKVTGDCLRHLSGMKALWQLNLDFTPTSDAGLEHLAALTGLTDLRLTRTQVTDEGLKKLAGMKKLRKLDLYHTQVTDAGLDALADLPELREVGLTGTKVTEEGFQRFTKARRAKGYP